MEIITLLVLVLIVIVMVLAMLMCDHRVDNGYIVGKAHHPMRAIQDWDSLLHYFYQEEIYDIAIDTVSDHFPNAGVYKSAVLVTYLLERLDRESLEFKKQLLT